MFRWGVVGNCVVLMAGASLYDLGSLLRSDISRSISTGFIYFFFVLELGNFNFGCSPWRHWSAVSRMVRLCKRVLDPFVDAASVAPNVPGHAKRGACPTKHLRNGSLDFDISASKYMKGQEAFDELWTWNNDELRAKLENSKEMLGFEACVV